MTDLTTLKDNLTHLKAKEHYARKLADKCCLNAHLAEREYAQASEAVRVAESELASAEIGKHLCDFRREWR